MNVGFAGAGRMGRPIIERMAAVAVVRVYDVDKSRGRAITRGRAEVIQTPLDFCDWAEVLFCSLPSPAAVESVVHAVLGERRSPPVIVDLSTNSPAHVLDLAKKCAEVGVSFLDAPLSGCCWGAEKGTLTAMVGGDRSVLDRVRSLLALFASTIVHVGPHGHGSMAKLIHNMVGETQVQIFAEAFCLGSRLGLNLDRLFEALANGMASSRILTQLYANGRLRGSPEVNVTLDAATKDQELLHELFHRIDVKPAFADSVLARLRALQGAGHGAEDVTATLLFFEQVYDTRVTLSPDIRDPNAGE